MFGLTYFWNIESSWIVESSAFIPLFIKHSRIMSNANSISFSPEFEAEIAISMNIRITKHMLDEHFKTDLWSVT